MSFLDHFLQFVVPDHVCTFLVQIINFAKFLHGCSVSFFLFTNFANLVPDYNFFYKFCKSLSYVFSCIFPVTDHFLQIIGDSVLTNCVSQQRSYETALSQKVEMTKV